MRRRVVVILIFLLAGAVVNVAVAWGILWAEDRHTIGPDQFRAGEEWPWPHEVPTHWPDTVEMIRREREFGVLRLSYSVGRFSGADPEPPALIANLSKHRIVGEFEQFSLTLWRAGWPMLGLECERWDELLEEFGTLEDRQRGGRPRITWRSEGHPPRSNYWVWGIPVDASGGWAGPRMRTRLPIRPSWPGFAVNTLFYAAILWLLIRGPFALRRLIRRRRGRCPACGYDLKHAGHESCPECGATQNCRPGRGRLHVSALVVIPADRAATLAVAPGLRLAPENAA